MKLIREARESSRRVGKRMLTTALKLSPDSLLRDYWGAVHAGACPGNSAAALGAVAATLGIPRRQAMLIGLYTFATNILGAAMRLARLHHEQSRPILTQLQ